MPTQEQVIEALRQVYDPELGLNIIDLGLVYDTRIEDGHVHVTMTLTSPGCPVGPQIKRGVREVLRKLEGVETVDVDLVWTPPWSIDRLSEDAKMELGIGY